MLPKYNINNIRFVGVDTNYIKEIGTHKVSSHITMTKSHTNLNEILSSSSSSSSSSSLQAFGAILDI